MSSMETPVSAVSVNAPSIVTQVTSPAYRTLAVVAAVVYSVVTTLQHDWAQQFVRNVQRVPVWTVVSLALVTIFLLVLTAAALRSLRFHQDRQFLGLSWAISAFLLYLSDALLMSVHTEAVHFLQYGILSSIAYLGFRNTPTTLAFVSVVGLLDEAYQYWGLYSGWGIYYDWNDVLLNVLAGGVGLLFLLTLRPSLFAREHSKGFLVRYADLLTLGGLVVIIAAGLMLGMIAQHPTTDMSGVHLLLDRGGPDSRFWLRAWWSGKFYHKVDLWVGLSAVFFVVLFYRWVIATLASRLSR